MESPVLYSFRRCPYAMRARMALLAGAQRCELREVDLRRKPAEMLEASPKGTVPVLIDLDGRVFEQSLDIMLWSLRRNDPLNWLPPTALAMRDTLDLIGECDGAFKESLDRYKYPDRYTDIDRLAERARGASYLGNLQRRLEQQAWLGDAHATLADYAILPFVRQYAMVEPDWFGRQPWLRLVQWLDILVDSPLFAGIMEKHAPWQSGQPGIAFPSADRFAA